MDPDPDPAIFVIDPQDESPKEVTKQQESRFVLLFLLADRMIRIRSRVAHKHVDPVDPNPDSDPEHFLIGTVW
jgi:hypothetical protein